MVGLVSTLNDAPAKAKEARSFGRNPKRAHPKDPLSTVSPSMAPEVTPCSSGAAPLPRAGKFRGEKETVLGALSAVLERSLGGHFSLPGRS